MKLSIKIHLLLPAVFFTALAINGCSKKNTDVVLPQIGGYNNSDEVASANLVSYFPLDGSANEKKTGTAPTASAGVTYGTGIKGQGATFTNGYLYYAAMLAPLTNATSFTVSAWVQVTNTGGAPLPGPTNVPYSYFQIARPGQLFGNFNGLIEAGQYKVASDTLVLKSIYADASGGLQDNINNYGVAGTDFKVVKAAGAARFVHVVTTYETNGSSVNLFKIYADSALVSNTNFQSRGTALFKATSPSEVIIGGWYNNIPGKTVTTDTWTVPFNGKIDEIRVYNKLLTQAEITALYQLGKAGR